MRTKRYEACELTGAIINFETYLFATKEKFYSQHTSFDEDAYIIDGTMHKNIFDLSADETDSSVRKIKVPMTNLETRQTGCKTFNHIVKNAFGNDSSEAAKGENYISIIIDIIDDSDNYKKEDMQKIYDLIIDFFYAFLLRTGKVGVIVPHFYQNERYPHIHLLYNRLYKKSEDFNAYMDELMKNK